MYSHLGMQWDNSKQDNNEKTRVRVLYTPPSAPLRVPSIVTG